MLLNIVILNYEYEIIALGVSSRMLVAATVLFLIYARDYTAFFWGGRPRAAQEPRPFGRRVILAGAIAKYAVVIYGLYTFLPLMWPGAGFRAKPELYGKWHVESVTTANSQGVVPSAFAPGSIWYFNVSKSFAVRTQDTVRTGTYDFEPRNRHVSVGVRDAQGKNVLHAFNGSYRRDGNDVLVLSDTSQLGGLTLRLRRGQLQSPLRQARVAPVRRQ